MDVGSDTASLSTIAALPRLGRQGAPGAGGARRQQGVRGQAGEEALLELREEATRAKHRERAAEDKMRQLAAQLARTEEAAKRILTRTDPSARGGVAQRLLDAESDLAGARMELAELRSQLARAKQVAGDRKGQLVELKSRLDTALASQRQLALQLGRLHAGGCTSARMGVGSNATSMHGNRDGTTDGNDGTDIPGNADLLQGSAAVEAVINRRFAAQQEQLAVAKEHSARLEVRLRQQSAAMEAQAEELRDVRAQLASQCAAEAGQTLHAASQPYSPGSRIHHSTTSTGTELERDAGQWDASWLRLKYLESRSALGRCTASSARMLQELEAARAVERTLREELQAARQEALQLQQLLEIQAAAHGRQSWQGNSGPVSLPGPDFTPRVQQTGGAGNVRHADGSRAQNCAAFTPLGSSTPVPASNALQLRQQLAAANYRAARLQIELDAALAKLVVFQERALWQQRQQQDFNAASSNDQPLQPVQPHQAQQPEHAPGRPHPSACTPGWSARLPGKQTSMSAPSSTHNNEAHAPDWLHAPMVVDLHLHSAELMECSPGGPAATAAEPNMTFITASIPGLTTAMTPVVQGSAPCYNTTLHLKLGGAVRSLSDLAEATAHVELHRCKSSSSGTADYATLGSALLPLAGLLAEQGSSEPAVKQQRPCTLLDGDGVPAGTLWFGMSARPAVAPAKKLTTEEPADAA